MANLAGCCTPATGNPKLGSGNAASGARKVRLALVGNANVGKSALFNCLTGLSQHVSNWPGKTVEIAQGKTRFANCEIEVVDLPGIYSLSAFSMEERIARDYILGERPDVVVNIVDASALERNLFLTMQLLELGVPVVVALNQVDFAGKKGIVVDAEKLSKLLGVPVVPTVAVRGVGVSKLLVGCLGASLKKGHKTAIRYGKGMEKGIGAIEKGLGSAGCDVNARYAAIKLLEGDECVPCGKKNSIASALKKARGLRARIKKEAGEGAQIAISNERYKMAGRIASEVQRVYESGTGLADRIDELTMHPLWGYAIMFLVLGGIFYAIFTAGGFASTEIANFFAMFRPASAPAGFNLIWEGLVGGFVAGLTLVLPYVLPFYLLLALLEDTGYIARVAYLLDGLARKIGFHGKAVIPILLGYGCNVPACIGCRILEYDRDRLIAAFAVTLVPCTARTVVILALVAAYLGIWWAVAIYALDLVLIAVLSKIAFKVLPGEPVGLIMEMPPYRMPSLRVVSKQTFMRIKSLLTIVFPYYIAGGLLLAVLQLAGILEPVNSALQPITVGWLGLPAFAGTLLIFGIVRKELVVVLPAILFGTANLAALFTPVQMLVLAFVTMLYIPCLATIEALRREFGIGKALFITALELVLAFALGGILLRVLVAAGLP